MLTVLSSVLIYVMHFPSKEEIQKNISICFVDFPDIKMILDYTEISIRKKKYLLSNNNIQIINRHIQ